MIPDFKKIEGAFSPSHNGKCTESSNGIFSAASPEASEAGAEMLKSGGNAVDAAVAAAFTLGVTEPQASGLGGQTMLLMNRGRQIIALDGSSRAPSLAHPGAIYKNDRSIGYRAATVPSTPAVLWYVHHKYGTLPWERLLEPAIHFAENGYYIGKLQNRLLLRERDKFLKIDSKSGFGYFYRNGEPYMEGDLFVQRDLGRLLRKLAEKGIEEFYLGETGKQIDADMRENGGLLRYDDLAWIPYPYERKPLKRKIWGVEIFTMPPPGSGRTLLSALMMLELFSKFTAVEDENLRNLLFLKIIRKALLERRERPFDPHFYPQVEEESAMTDKHFIRKLVNGIISEIDASDLPIIPSGDEETGETTHLSVIDNDGNAVSLTQSIERVYGSKAAAEGLGFLYNNYLFDFEYDIPGHPYYLRPNLVPWATVAPSLVFHDRSIWMALGSPGSERIISTLAYFLYTILYEEIPIDAAMEAPRLHCSLGGRVSLEAEGFPETTVPYLREKGYRIDKRERLSFYLGCVQAVLRKHDGSGFQGVADIRREGKAATY